MLNILFSTSVRTSLFLSLIFFIGFYSIWFFEDYQIVRPHDNLDGGIVINHIIGQFFSGYDLAEQLPLNGVVSIWSFDRLLSPLTLLYALLSPWHAYALTDLIIRLTAFLGFFLLGQKLKVYPIISAVIGLTFATSISYSHFLMSIAGIPLIVWLLTEMFRFENLKLVSAYMLLFFLGTNISLSLSGIFLLIFLPITVFLGFKAPQTHKLFFGFFYLTSGIFLGSANLFYNLLFGNSIPHRSERYGEWFSRSDDYSLIQGIIEQANWTIFSNPWYHVTYSLWFSVFAVLLAIFFLHKAKLEKDKSKYINGLMIFFYLLLSIFVIFIFSNISLSDFLMEKFTIARSFSWNRFYFLYSFLIFILLLLSFKVHSKNTLLVSLLFLTTLLQLTFNLYQTPHTREILRIIAGKEHLPSFSDYYHFETYTEIKKITKRNPVLSVGLDPMIAPMNNIPSIDGYYVMYPLSYKYLFREVIADSLPDSPEGAEYFDNWGNRVYTFHPPGRPDLINFCRAKNIGANYLIASMDIAHHSLKLVETYSGDLKIYLYQISSNGCMD